MRNILGFATAENLVNVDPSSRMASGIVFILILLFVFLILLGIYIYLSIAFTKIGKKINLKYPAIAWIPVVGPLINAMLAAKMHWWPFILFGASIIFDFMTFFYASFTESFISIVLMGLIGSLIMISFLVFATIWLWKMFEAVKQPGFFALALPLYYLSSLVPIFGVFFAFPFAIAFFVFVGIAAWSKN